MLLRPRRRPHGVVPHAPRRVERLAPADRRPGRAGTKARGRASTSTSSSRRAPATAATCGPSRRSSRPSSTASRPGLLLVACGQDANQFDPNGQPVRVHGRLSPRLARRRARSPSGIRAAGWCSRRRAATRAPTRPSACTPRWPACSESTSELEDPCAYMPDDPAHADAELAAVEAALAPYWTL